MKKYFILTVLIACISIILTACKSKSDEAATEADTTPITYRLMTIEIPDWIFASDVVITDDAVYYLDSGGVVRIDYEGNVEKLFSLPQIEYFTCLFIDDLGRFNAITNKIGEDGSTVTGLTVHCFNPDGRRWSRKTLSPFAESDKFRHAVNFLVNDGYYYVQSMSGVYVYDKSGELVYEALGDGDTFSRSLFVLEDGRVGSASARFENNDTMFIVRVYNIDDEDFDEYQVSVSGSVQDAIITNGGATGLLLGDNSGLFEFELGNNRNPLLSFLERGVNAADIMDIHMTQEGEIIIILKRGIINAGDILVFSEHGQAGTLTADEGWVEADLTDSGVPKIKEVVTLAIPDNNAHQSGLRSYIAEFNKTNPDYLIEIISYDDGNSGWQWDEDAVRRFSIAIGTGQVADIVAFPGGGVPIYSYTSKGLFVDLYEIMGNDPDFNKADYLPGVFEALETDGKLYTIFPNFWLMTVVAKTSAVGGQPGLSIDEFIAYLDSEPGAQDIIMYMDRESFIFYTSMNYFADRETGRMTFDRDIFMKILKAAERFQLEPTYDTVDDWGAFPYMRAREGDPLMIYHRLLGGAGRGLNFRNIRSYEYYFGEEVTYIGFPTPNGSGSSFSVRNRFAISEQSAKKEGAWQFIKFMMDTFLSDSHNSMNNPIKISLLEEEAYKATIESYSKGGVLIDREVFLGLDSNGQFMIVALEDRDNTPEENQKLWDLLYATNTVMPHDTVVMDIIREEIRYYITGQKSAEVVMDIIENRVNLYLSELE